MKVHGKDGKRLVEDWKDVEQYLVSFRPQITLVVIIDFVKKVLSQNNSQYKAHLEEELNSTQVDNLRFELLAEVFQDEKYQNDLKC